MRNSIKALLLVAFALFGLGAVAAVAATVSWTPPDTRVDGSALDPGEIEFYELCVSDQATPVCTDNPYVFETTTTSVPVESLDLPYGTWYFTVRVQDTNGLQSEWSDVVSHQILAPPSPPAGLGVN